MDVVVAILVLFAGLGTLIYLGAKAVELRQRAVTRAQQRSVQRAQWKVAEVPDRVATSIRGSRVTSVVVRRETADGKVLGSQIVVASVPDGAADWGELMLDARAQAAARADLLNTQP